MIERTVPHFGRLVFDRDAIVRAALRAYVADAVEDFPCTVWMGDLQRGAIYNGDGCGDYEVVAWSEVGVVGLAYDLGCGPIEQLGLSVDAVTGGPDDVRGAVPGLPEKLEPVFSRAVGMLGVGPERGERDAGAGFWLYGDRVGGTLFLFEDPTQARGVDRLAAWGLLRGDRLPLACGGNAIEFDPDHPAAVPFQAVIDAVTARALAGPTELTPDELATLLPTPPDPKGLLGNTAQASKGRHHLARLARDSRGAIAIRSQSVFTAVLRREDREHFGTRSGCHGRWLATSLGQRPSAQTFFPPAFYQAVAVACPKK